MAEVKKDCFAYMNGNCRALDGLYCSIEKCRFYKTQEQENKDRNQAIERAAHSLKAR